MPAAPSSVAVPVPAVGPAESWGPAPLEPLRLVVLEFSLRTGSLDQLDSVVRALAGPGGFEERARGLPFEEVAYLATCHRAELVLVLAAADDLGPWRESLPGPRDGWRVHEGREGVVHLFRVAAGEESLARGEREVRDQVRRAASSLVSRHPRPLLRPLLEAAVAAAEEAAPHVPASRSIAAVAATRALELVARPFPRALVIGTGTVGRQLAELLAPYARVTVAYRQHPPDPAFLRAVGARAVGPGELAEELRLSEIVFTAAKAGQRCLGPEELPADRPVVVVDLGVPRNVAPSVRERPGVTLVDLEGLARSSPSGLIAPTASPRTEARIDRAMAELDRALLEPWISAVLRSADGVRRAELDVARGYLGPLTPAQSEAIDRMSRRLVTRLMQAPTGRLRSLPTGPDGERLRRFALELLRPGS